MLKVKLLTILLYLSHCATSQTIRYVKNTASGNGSGTSWSNASSDLQGIINLSNSTDEVWVAAGTYTPQIDTLGNSNPSNSKTKTFKLKSGVKLYGSFIGNENSLSERVIDVNTLTSILDGSQGGGAKSYHVVTANNTSLSTILNGFEITNGNADTSPFDTKGGGVFVNGKGVGNSSQLQIKHCLFKLNEGWLGAGLAVDGENGFANCQVDSCVFDDNEAFLYGGGIFGIGTISILNSIFKENSTFILSGGACYFALESIIDISKTNFDKNNSGDTGGAIHFDLLGNLSPLIDACFFTENSSDNGGALYFYSNAGALTPVISNSVFYKNNGTSTGGAIVNVSEISATDTAPEIVNCTFAQNSALNGKAIFNLGSGFNINGNPPIIRNSIIWGVGDGSVQHSRSNAKATVFFNSIVEAGDTLNSCRNFDPFFIDSNNGDLRLNTFSPAINAGNNAYIGSIVFDIAGNPRNFCLKVDMGAFEHQNVNPNYTLTQNPTTTGTHHVYRATNYILFEPGFGVNTGGNFTAEIDGCL